MFLVGILIFKELTARRLYKSFGVKGLIAMAQRSKVANVNVLKHGTHFLDTNKQTFYAKLPGKTTCQIRWEYTENLYTLITHTQ
jgi:hypothetical protein